jgi:hypothetical protein
VTYTSGSFNGSANVTGTATLANSGVTAGTYTKLTVDAKGRVTVGALLASADLPTYTGSITTGQVTTALGFTPYNATNPSGYITSSASITGNAATATTLQTARTINGVSFNGSADITVADATKLPLAGGTMTGTLVFGNATSPNTNFIQFGDNTGWTFRFMTSVSGTPTERFRFVDTGAFNAVGAITQNGSQVLHAGNYTSYSPSLTGTGASGTWGISITGNAATVTNGVYTNGSYADPAWITAINYSKLTGTVPTWNQNTTGSAATLTTARTINGVSFNGSANITVADSTKLPLAGGTLTGAITFAAGQTWPTFNQSTTGSAAIWTTARTLWGNSVDGSANITAPLLPAAGTAALPAFSTSGDTDTGIFFPAADTIAFAEGGVEVMRIDSTGVLGVGVVPSAWGTGFKTTQFGTGSIVANAINGASFNSNWYFDSAAARYISTGSATRYLQTNGTHRWFNAPSGTAGDVVTLTETARIDAAGNFGIGTDAPTEKLHVVGNIKASGTVTATTFIGALTGNASTATTATTLATARNINGVSFNGSADITVADATKLPLAGGTLTGAVTFAAGQTWPTFNQSTTGSAATLTTGRTIALTGDVTYTSGSFNGSANVTGTATLASSGVTAGTYTKVTVDAKGRVTVGASIAAGDVPTLNQSTTGNAATATTLATARAINGVSFNGSADITVADATKLPLAGGTMTGAITFAAGQTWPTFNQNTTGTAATITGVYSGTITSSQVTTGLGFTPYNATNPNSYIALASAITGYAAGTNTALAATDTLLAALGKIQGQITARSGTVTSVGGTGTVSGLTLSGTVTTTGNLTLGGTLAVTASNFASQTANTVLAAPNGAAGVPTFRALVAADIPTLNQNTTGSAASLTTARTIGGVSFNGTANINLPGVNTAGNQNTTGNAATATTATNSTQLGGVAAASYAQLGTTQTFTGSKTFTGGLFSAAYNIATYVSMYGDTNQVQISVSASAVNNVLTINSSGNLTISGNTAVKSAGSTWVNPSDSRLKDNIASYTKGLNELVQIEPKSFTFNGKGGSVAGLKAVGVIADDIEQVLPDTVQKRLTKLNPDDTQETEVRYFDASELTWVMINAIKEQQTLLQNLSDRLTALEAANV